MGSLFLFLLSHYNKIGASTYVCTNCDADDVQSLIFKASNGDTIKIPAGNYIWRSGVNMRGKEITIIGDGVSKTTITDDASGNNYLFYSTGSNWRIAHMTIKNGSVKKGIIWLDGSYNTGWRIDNIYFDEMSGRAIWIGREDDGENYGLIDNCTFYDSSGAPAIIQVFGNAEGGWGHKLRLGSQYAGWSLAHDDGEAAYHALGLRTFLTTGEKESRAWTFRAGSTAPECAGVIHTDFQTGFIRAETIQWDELLAAGSWTAARDIGKVRSEGKDYVVADGDVIEFRFNV